LLINADLFACGIEKPVKMIGFGPFGISLPVIMGVIAVKISPTLARAAMPEVVLNGIKGSVSVSGLFGLAVTPFERHVLRIFPLLVTGPLMTLTGFLLMSVG
ncbi:purine permease, partial [Methylobacterium sp. J-048]|nr:purine permease [Methylobacterium sp. J-048]